MTSGNLSTPAALSTQPPALAPRLPPQFLWICRRLQIKLTRFVLIANVSKQQLSLFEIAGPRTSPALPNLQLLVGKLKSDMLLGRALLRVMSAPANAAPPGQPVALLRHRYIISTSRFGIGQQSGSNQTPLGLHRIAEKIGAGHPVGTVFESRRAIGFTWQGKPAAAIAHRILWLDGLEPGFNRGGSVDSHARYIYIHGLANEPSLGRPASRGCIHMAGADLIPLFDLVPSGSLVWIG